MTLHYRNRSADTLAHYDLLNPNAVRIATASYQQNSIILVILLVLGIIWGSAVALYLGCVYLTALVYYVYQIAVYPRKFRDTIEQTVKAQPEKEIVLVVTETGITELCDDIESFVPWKAIISYQLIDGRLFIQLKSGLWAIIPKAEITQGAEYFDSLVERLAEKEIPVRPVAAK